MHATGPPHTPAGLHVSTPLFEHRVAPMAQTPVHAPFTQVELTQSTGAPQFPVASHVSTPLAEHWVAPGMHVPLHRPAVQVPMHALAVPHWPLALQACTPLPWHVVWLGAQTPVQTPPAHVWLVHATVGPHAPAAVHVWAPTLVGHWTAPGEHSTHTPFQQTGVAPAHMVWSCHWPDTSHCCTTAPAHCTWPGAQTPVHTRATQAWFTQHFDPHAVPPSQSGGT
jgi:hypothetical protein